LVWLIFEIGYYVYVQAGLNCDSPIYASVVAGIIHMCHHTQLLLVEMGLKKFFAWDGLELPSSGSLPLEELRLQA
jgi:hypothetical protein